MLAAQRMALRGAALGLYNIEVAAAAQLQQARGNMVPVRGALLSALAGRPSPRRSELLKLLVCTCHAGGD